MKKITVDSSVNTYFYKMVGDQAIARKAHRNFVGGMWEEIGALQFEFLKHEGLLPHHTLLDVGCGCLRGGLKFIEYLNVGRYCGLDINSSLLKAARVELEQANLTNKFPKLLLDQHFAAERFEEKFDYALAVSLFTHLPLNHIGKCLKQVANVLDKTGAFYATYFEAPEAVFIKDIRHKPGEVLTYYAHDPYHFSFDEISWLANKVGLVTENIGDWGHPRAQKMLKFSLNRTVSGIPHSLPSIHEYTHGT